MAWISIPSNAWSLGSTWVHISNGTSIGSAVSAQLTVVTNRQTHKHTHREYRPKRAHLCTACMRCGLKRHWPFPADRTRSLRGKHRLGRGAVVSVDLLSGSRLVTDTDRRTDTRQQPVLSGSRRRRPQSSVDVGRKITLVGRSRNNVVAWPGPPATCLNK